MSEERRLMLPDTGDPAENARQIADFIRHDEAIQAGNCPNGCGAMDRIDAAAWECPRCYFQFHKGSIGV